MSTVELDAITARLVNEYADLKKQLAARLAEADLYGKAYHAALSYLCARHPNSGLRHGVPARCLDDVPDIEHVKANCADVLELINRRKEVFASLRDMGHEPKDAPILA